MSGHGWVVPLPSGAKARCGGPGICKECRSELLPMRSDDVQEKMKWLLAYDHLPEGDVRQTSARVANLAISMLLHLKDGPQLVIGLQRLVDAKDALVRQAIADGQTSPQTDPAAGFTSDPSPDTRPRQDVLC